MFPIGKRYKFLTRKQLRALSLSVNESQNELLNMPPSLNIRGFLWDHEKEANWGSGGSGTRIQVNDIY